MRFWLWAAGLIFAIGTMLAVVSVPPSTYLHHLNVSLLDGCYADNNILGRIKDGDINFGTNLNAKVEDFYEENNHFNLKLAWEHPGVSNFEDFAIVYWSERPHQKIRFPKKTGQAIILKKISC